MLYVTPAYAAHDSIHLRLAHAIFSGKAGLSFAVSVTLAYFAHLILGVLGGTIRFAQMGSIYPSPLGIHIFRIGLVSSKPKMRRVDTGMIITGMANEQTIWNRAEMNHPRDAVRTFALAASSACTKLTITVRMPVTSPLPTIIRAALVYLFPEAIRKWANGVRAFVWPGMAGEWKSVSMAANKADGLTPDVTRSAVSSLSDWSELTTSAFAQSGDCGWNRLAVLMTRDEAGGLTLNVSEPSTSFLGNRGWQSTSTFAELGGMIHDVVSSFQLIGHATGRLRSVAVALLLGCATGVIIPRMGA